MTAGLSPNAFYRDPTARERAQARAAVEALLRDHADTEVLDRTFGELGFRTFQGTDPRTGRPYSLFTADRDGDRPWGVVLVDRSTAPRVVVEVPHPGFDVNTDDLGLEVARSTPGAVLLIAGAHRQTAGGDGDVAHNDGSVFHTMADEFARGGLPQVQLHGFADRNLEGADAVVSAGSADVTRDARRLAALLDQAGIAACRAWAQRCGRLEGTTNVQGQSAARLGTPFIHLELSWSVRGDQSRLLAAAKAVGSLYAGR
ncbi:hypothetical protein [Catellatospora sp. IY07-71]|uniref:hypothetical protein n=1 Tax=Catellatospora sp. IY07-71 TaxID=2728827 RepID=UPI001BB32F64|nr:hypothetical protein [Catellatospora sp. IY07-71]